MNPPDNKNAIALQQSSSSLQISSATYIPTQSDWAFMVQWGAQAVRSGMLPSSVKNAEAAAIIILKGRELGLSFMTAMSHIHVINGKPSMSAELLQAMARKNLPGLKIVPVEVTATKAHVKFLRPEADSEWFHSIFTIEDAKAADLLKNPSWQRYPKAMLWSRAVTAGLRIVCPEALAGGVSHTPEELGANVDESGNVIIETTSRTVANSDEAIEKPERGIEFDIDFVAKKTKLHEINKILKEKAVSSDKGKEYLAEHFGKTGMELLPEEMMKFEQWAQTLPEFDPNFDKTV